MIWCSKTQHSASFLTHYAECSLAESSNFQNLVRVVTRLADISAHANQHLHKTLARATNLIALGTHSNARGTESLFVDNNRMVSRVDCPGCKPIKRLILLVLKCYEYRRNKRGHICIASNHRFMTYCPINKLRSSHKEVNSPPLFVKHWTNFCWAKEEFTNRDDSVNKSNRGDSLVRPLVWLISNITNFT